MTQWTDECLPVSSSKKRPNRKLARPGWSDFVKPFRDKAYFWSQVWKSAGRPLNCELHKVMKRTRNIYHYQVKKIKKSENLIKKNKLLDACLNGGGDIFKEIKQMRQQKPIIATAMDGVSEDIPEHFKGIYEELYNSVNDKEEIDELCKNTEEKINRTQLFQVDKVTPEVVKNAAKNLKDNKSDPTYSYSSDCIKNGPMILFEKLSLVFQSFLIHGHLSLFLLLATLIPIIKDKLSSASSSKNYRSIAISSLF